MLDVTKYPPSAHGFTCRNCGGGDRGRVAIYRPFGEVSLSLNRTVTCMVLKANDRRTSCPCHDEFRGPRSDYVRQVALATTTTSNLSCGKFTKSCPSSDAKVTSKSPAKMSGNPPFASPDHTFRNALVTHSRILFFPTKFPLALHSTTMNHEIICPSVHDAC
ncbi:uncharacterized protein TNCV_4514681 [Trichonephila clavipes]|nr:uncharacterized protein TNCV_4514681 [Trichonephila clavipes]